MDRLVKGAGKGSFLYNKVVVQLQVIRQRGQKAAGEDGCRVSWLIPL
jgi:hypothetical protein